MKKIVASLLILVFLTGTFSPVLAQEPHEAGAHNSFVTMELSLTQAVKALAGKVVGFNIVGDVIPIVSVPDTLNYTDMTPFNLWLRPAFTNLQSGWFTANNKIIPFTQTNVESARYCAKLIIDSPYTTPSRVVLFYLTEPNTVQVSQNIPWTQDLYTYAQLLGSIMSAYKKDANAAGQLEYNKPKEILARISKEDCGMNNSGVSHELQNVDVKTHAVFPAGSAVSSTVNITLWITKIIDGVLKTVLDLLDIKMKLVLTKKARLSWGAFLCLLGYGCADKDNAEIVTNHSATPNDGMAAMWVSASQRRDPVGWGSQNNSVKILGDVNRPIKYDNTETGVNRSYEGMRQSACSFTANELIPNYKIGGTIPIADACKPPPQCPIDAIAQMPDPPGCNLCNTQAYSSFQFLTDNNKKALQFGIPPLMTKVLNVAASTYHIPASLLLGTMLEEGAFNHPEAWVWSDASVRTFSNCTVPNPMSECAQFASGEGAKPPFGFIDTYWQNYVDSGGPYKGKYYEVQDPTLKKVAASVLPKNISSCNFTDAAFTAAREISEDQSHYYVDQPPINTPLPASCGGVTISHDRSIPASCNAWTSDRVGLMRMQYGERQCTEGSNGSADVTGSVGRMVATFTKLTCGGP